MKTLAEHLSIVKIDPDSVSSTENKSEAAVLGTAPPAVPTAPPAVFGTAATAPPAVAMTAPPAVGCGDPAVGCGEPTAPPAVTLRSSADWGRIGGLKCKANLTPEQRLANSRKANEAKRLKRMKSKIGFGNPSSSDVDVFG